MKPSELRIGNYLYDDEGNLCKVARIETPEYTLWNSGESCSIIAAVVGSGGGYIYHAQDSSWKPVQLTDEWLLKFGFSFDAGVYWGERIILRKASRDRDEYHLVVFDGNEWLVIDFNLIQYVHQIQNIQFALTGEELEIKEVEKV